MSLITARLGVYLLVVCCAIPMLAQQPAATVSSASTVVVPPLVNFSGVLTDVNGKPLTGVVGVTFALYAESQGGAPLWLETQNVYPDKTGHYTVMLGSTSSTGIPAQIFVAGEAHWLGVQPQGQAEQPRVMLLSVPYALKAADAQTLAGLPPSAFVPAAPSGTRAASASSASASSSSAKPAVAGSGSQNYIPVWTDNSGDLGNSLLFQSGGNVNVASGAGITINGTQDGTGNALVPNQLFFQDNGEIASHDANHRIIFDRANNILELREWGNIEFSPGSPGTRTDSVTFPTGGGITLNTGGLTVNGTGNGSGSTLVPNQLFFQDNGEIASHDANHRIIFDRANNNLELREWGNIVFSPGSSGQRTATVTISKSGLNVAGGASFTQPVTFASSQTFPGTATLLTNTFTGNQTVNGSLSVSGGASFTQPVTFASSQTFPNMAGLGANTFTGNQTVNGNVSATGLVTGTGFNIGSNLFAWGSWANGNAFVGYAGNTAMTGHANTASGYEALYSNTTGSDNTASGAYGLFSNTTGFYNTASGLSALYSNTTGYDNTASGYDALWANTTGVYNTADGYTALESNTTASANVAVGYQALQSNVGDSAGDGWYNTAVGANALLSNSDADSTAYKARDNTAVGYSVLYSNTTGAYNTGVGVNALYTNTIGPYNTAIGYQALQTNTQGNVNTAIGAFANVGSNSLTNATAIGADAYVTQSNSLVLGSIQAVNGGNANTNVGIGTTAPEYVFTIGQGHGSAVADGWGVWSSRRWKTNIQPLHGALAKIERLRGVSYDLKANGKHEIGVIAEEVSTVVPEVVTWDKNGKDAAGVDYSRLTALLIEATKEQQTLIHKQEQQIRAQQAKIARLSSQVKAIQASLNTNGRAGSEVRIVKAQRSMVHQ